MITPCRRFSSSEAKSAGLLTEDKSMSDKPKKPSIIEAARRGASKPVLVASTDTDNQIPKTVSKKADLKQAGETITYQCGHKIGVHYLEGQACPSCRDKARKDRNLRRKEKREAETTPGEPKKKLDDQGRLPDGSLFANVVYDAHAVMWSGELQVPDAILPGQYHYFNGQASGVEHLLRQLAGQYRLWKVGQEAAGR